MNGRVSKYLRNLARKVTTQRPVLERDERGTVRYVDGCYRRIYKDMKKEYKEK